MGLLEMFDPLVRSLRQSKRRYWLAGGRAHIEYRPVPGAKLAALGRKIEEGFKGLGRVQWSELNPHTGRVVVAFEPGAYTIDELVAVVDGAEQAMGAPDGFDRDGLEHPGDEAPVMRAALEVGASVVGLGLGVALKASPLPAVGLGASVAGGLSVLGAVPFLRRSLDEALTERGTNHLINLLTPLAYGSSQKRASPFVDLVHRLGVLSERQARRKVWQEREEELCSRPAGVGEIQVPAPPREVPPGPIEQYAASAWQVALGAFGVSLVTTGSVRRAASSLLVGLPKPARLGREAFAGQVGRALAERGVLPANPEAIRRLDRVNCLVLQADLVPRQRFVLGSVVADGVDAHEARMKARALFLPDTPLEVRHEGGWGLGPLPLLGAAPEKLAIRARELGRSGALVLGVERGGAVVALAEVQIVPQTGVEELIKTARDAQMRVVVAGARPGALPGFDADDIVPGGAALPESIRKLQDEGHVVCFVATGGEGLAVADVGVGLCRAGEAPPWGAHLICGEDLTDVRFILQACVSARVASRQSVQIAAAAAALGGFLSAGGFVPMDAQRAIFLVNSASLLTMGNGARVAYTLTSKPLPPPRDPTPWHALDPEGALARLQSSPTGLTSREAALRQRPEVTPPAILDLGRAVLDEVLNPLVPLLAAGAGMSAFVGSFVDAGLVAGVVGLNAVVGGVQRFQAERAVRALQNRALRRAVVLRGGQRQVVDAATLVKGDMLYLQAGDVVPADCRLIEAVSLEVDASSLTGEALPVSRGPRASFERDVAERSSMLYEGSVIAAGRATAVIVAVGRETEAGRAESPKQAARPRVGVEARLSSLVALTGPAAGAAGLGVLVAGLLREQKLQQLVGSAVSLAVASVPEGLPLLATASQLAAAERLSRRGALVKHPRALEALGRVDVVCVDKTGTVTEGKIALASVSDGATDEPLDGLSAGRRSVLVAALRATPLDALDGGHPEAVDEALARGARSLGVQVGAFKAIDELSFEARRGFHAVLGETDGVLGLHVKGAPEVILPRCTSSRGEAGDEPMDERRRAALALEVNRFAARGLRVLAVAERRLPGRALDDASIQGLSFRGFVAFSDPVRPTAASAIASLRRAGIEVIMITGDHPSTAEAIAAKLDLLRPGGLLTGAELDEMSDGALAARLPSIKIFARVTPVQKVRVVQALQRAGRVVAMAGDGANDAPAIRLADVGIAVGSRSTAAARGAADVVLTDERIEMLFEAVLESRAMWTSVRDAVSVLVGGNLGEVAFTLLGSLATGQPPLNPRQLLLVNLLTDVAPAMTIALRPPSAGLAERLMRQGPEAALGRPLYRDILFRGAATAAGASAAWITGKMMGSDAEARTMGMVALVGTQLGQTLVSGEMSTASVVASVGSTALLFGVVQTPLVSQFFGCTPLGPVSWGAALASSALASWASTQVDTSSVELPWRFQPAQAPKGALG